MKKSPANFLMLAYDHSSPESTDTTSVSELQHRLEKERSTAQMAQRACVRIAQLYSVSMAVNRALQGSPNEFLKSVLTACLEAADALGGWILLLNDSDPPSISSYAGSPAFWQRFPPGNDFLERLYRENDLRQERMIWLETDDLKLWAELLPPLPNNETQAIGLLPLIAEGHLLGLMALGSDHPEVPELSEQEYLLQLARTIADALLTPSLLNPSLDKTYPRTQTATRSSAKLETKLPGSSFAAVQEDAQSYKTLVEMVPQIAWITDAGGELIFINTQWTLYTGSSLEEAKERGWNSYLHPDDVPHAREAGEAAAARPSEYKVEYRLRGADGSYRWFLTSGVPEFSVDGELLHWYGTCTEIDERKRTEQREHFLSDLGDFMRLHSDPADVLKAAVEEVGKYLRVSHCSYLELDLAQDRLLVHTDYSSSGNSPLGSYRLSDIGWELIEQIQQGEAVLITDAMTDPRTAAVYESLFLPGKIRSFVGVPLIKDNRWVAMLVVSMIDEVRKWTCDEVTLLEQVLEQTWLTAENARLYRAAYDELAERERVTLELHKNEERTRLIIEAAYLGLWDWDLITNQVSWGGYHEQLVGMAPGEFEGVLKQFLNSIHPEDRDRVVHELESAIADHTYVDSDYRVIWKDGTTHWVNGKGRAEYDSLGHPIRMCGVLYDITDRKQAESDREQHLAEIEKLNERLRRAVQETHHRVKNNLQVISAMANLQTLKGTDFLPTYEFVRLMQHVRTLAIVHDILTQESRADRSITQISARVTLDSLLPLLENTVRDRNLEFDVEDIYLPLRQTSSLAMLVNELVSNAEKHGSGNIRLKLSASGQVGRLTVFDQGPGFPENFDPLTAANTGLELVHSLACWDMGGKVEFNNSEDGAEVIVTFPLIKP